MTINTPTEHDNALQRIGELMEIQPELEPTSELGKELDILVDAVVKYENIHYPI